MLSSQLAPRQGFHTTFTTVLSTPRTSEHCSLHLFFVLPPVVFVDPYELSNRKEDYSFDFWGTSNLELPVAAVPDVYSALLLNLTLPQYAVEQSAMNLTIDLPLHLRYQHLYSVPTAVDVQWPVGFWSCPRTRMLLPNRYIIITQRSRSSSKDKAYAKFLRNCCPCPFQT